MSEQDIDEINYKMSSFSSSFSTQAIMVNLITLITMIKFLLNIFSQDRADVKSSTDRIYSPYNLETSYPGYQSVSSASSVKSGSAVNSSLSSLPYKPFSLTTGQRSLVTLGDIDTFDFRRFHEHRSCRSWFLPRDRMLPQCELLQQH